MEAKQILINDNIIRNYSLLNDDYDYRFEYNFMKFTTFNDKIVERLFNFSGNSFQNIRLGGGILNFLKFNGKNVCEGL